MATQLVCPHCRKVLEFSSDPPAFCAYCGHALSKQTVVVAPTPSTGNFDVYGSTLPPRDDDTAQSPFLTPQIVGKYRLLSRLGSGGMGSVYLAEHVESNRRVALKLLSGELSSSKDAVQRFRQEGRLASGIVHPRCVFVYAADQADGQSYIVMELMPGDTLRDLVQHSGPLSPNEGIAKILDVIDGLLEAHRLEVVHRDVKPSNCFLEADGRVKVGDFGLAKSLVSRNQANLTRTGSFLGTPHFASPEQVRGEAVDSQTDVYSLAATLYYLFTGAPPFSGSDAASTLARIVSDPPPSMRTLRPELPNALDRVVLKGLERDRQRRFRDLQEFRDALVALLPRAMSGTSLAVRLAAFATDLVVAVLVVELLKWVVRLGATVAGLQSPLQQALTVLGAEAAGAMAWIFYFAVGESMWGSAVGKRWLRLRVRTGDGLEKPSPRQILLRTLVAFALFQLGWLATTTILLAAGGAELVMEPLRMLLGWTWFAVGALLSVSTMRESNGYRGLHELASGTGVVALPWPRKRPKPVSVVGWFLYLKRSGRLTGEGGSRVSLPDMLGGFTIRGATRWTPEEKILLGEDTALNRKVLIYARPLQGPDVDANRLKINRITRVRWLGSGTDKDLRWDSFLAPLGCPLPELIASEKRLPWTEVRPVLEQLADELVAAMADNTLPQHLSCDQVWVQHNGRVQLVDSPTDRLATAPDAGATAVNARCLDFLRQVTVLAMEGRVLSVNESPQAVRAPMPEHVQKILNRVVGLGEPYTTVTELRADFSATAELPSEVTPANRGAQLALQAAFLLPALLFMFLPGMLTQLWIGDTVVDPESTANYGRAAWPVIGAALIWPLLWVCWAFITRGGLSSSIMNIVLMDSSGRRASRWRCALRALIVWSPIMLLLVSTYWFPSWLDIPETPAMFQVCWLSCWAVIAAMLAAYLVRASLTPQRALHDVWSDVFLVPK